MMGTLSSKKYIFDDAGRPVYWPHPDPNEPWIETALIDPKTGKKIYERSLFRGSHAVSENSFILTSNRLFYLRMLKLWLSQLCLCKRVKKPGSFW